MEEKEIMNEEVFLFVAADGTPQMPLIGETYEECIAITELFATRSLSRPVAELFGEGWNIIKARVIVTQIGTPESAFNESIKP